MHIKQIIISGFKSYRDDTRVEPFDARRNVIVGRNRSGKSNFFDAIQFVLSDEFSLGTEERHSLLYEASGSAAIEAYVEIIFDNRGSRLAIDKDEVALRRVIGTKKDAYYLNEKLITRAEVSELLESPLFSRSNPYYIVKQGHINEIAIASPSQLLNFLQEVAGAGKFDEKQEEILNILKSNNEKCEQVARLLHTIEERFRTCQQEKKQLEEFERLVKQQTFLRYFVYDKEAKDSMSRVDQFEIELQHYNEEHVKLVSELEETAREAKCASTLWRDANEDMKRAVKEEETINATQQNLLDEKSRLEYEIQKLTNEMGRDGDDSKARAELELKELIGKITSQENELKELKSRYEAEKNKEKDCTRELFLKEQKLSDLLDKQLRGRLHSTKDERDESIQKKIRTLSQQIKDKLEHRDRLDQYLKDVAEKQIILQNRIEERTAIISDKLGLITQNEQMCSELKKVDPENERKELWLLEDELQRTLSFLKEKRSKADWLLLQKVAGKATMEGRNSVRTVLEIFRQRGGRWAKIANNYYGQVIENFQCNPDFQTAAEVAAGRSLFFHIVESHEIGRQILKEINKQNLPGEVTFIPCDREMNGDEEYPDINNAVPMITKIKYAEKIDKAMRYVFGKTLICANWKIALKISKQNRGYHLDCVTKDGDKVSWKGSMTGGYYGNVASKLEIHNQCNEFIEKITDVENQLAETSKKLEIVGAKKKNVEDEILQMESENIFFQYDCENMRAELRLAREELSAITRSQSLVEKSMEQAFIQLNAMQCTKDSLEAELHEELMLQLCASDQLEMDQLKDAIKNIKLENDTAFASRMELKANKNILENLLTNNLTRRDEMIKALQEMEERKCTLENSTQKLEAVELNLEQINENYRIANKKIESALKQQQVTGAQLEEWQAQEKHIQDKLNKATKDLLEARNKVTIFRQKVEACQTKMNKLGVNPTSEIIEKYEGRSQENLLRERKRVTARLKAKRNLNYRVLDQLVRYSSQKEILINSKNDFDRNNDKINDHLRKLEEEKCRCIELVFEQVSQKFSDVFNELVPGGRAQLVMKNAGDEDSMSISDDDSGSEYADGVLMKISFTAREEVRELHQLAGHQKSLVALAFIFAIQLCDPAPFYLFDEIDQGLHPQHRDAVGRYIRILSNEAQFFTSTYQPELLQYADKLYGVKNLNEVTHVECITKEEALNILNDTRYQ